MKGMKEKGNKDLKHSPEGNTGKGRNRKVHYLKINRQVP